MKVPLIHKLSAVGGIFARLNPVRLMAKIKARKGDPEPDGERDFLPNGDDGDDLFADLGDLDQLDNEANEKAPETSLDEDDDFDDKDDGPLDEGDIDPSPTISEHSAAADIDDDLDSENAPAQETAQTDLAEMADFSAHDGFDDDDEDEEAAEAAQKAKLKKLALMAGAGVALATVLGGVSWWFLGAQSGDPANVPDGDQVAAVGEPARPSPGGLVIDLDLAAPRPVARSAPTPSPANTPAARTPDARTTALVPPKSSVTPSPQPSPSAPDAAPSPFSAETTKTSPLARLGLDVAMEPGVGVVIPATTKASFEGLAPWPPAAALVAAPIKELVEQSDTGLLPVIGADGTTAYAAYARPTSQANSTKPKIAIIVTGLGMSRAATEAAISAMPADVTLALDVYARGLGFWVSQARKRGHEVLLNMPSQSSDFPFSDPGPRALDALAAPADNLRQLQWIMGRTTGYFGLLSVYGSKFLTVEDQLTQVMEVLKKRGVMYVDGGAEDSLGARVANGVGAKWAAVDLTLDQTPGRAGLTRQLDEFEALAKKRAVSIARVSINPATLTQLSAWLKTLDKKGLQLVPVSALANKQLVR